MAKQQKKGATTRSKSRVPDIPEPIFGANVSDIVPGEVLIQVAPTVADQITSSIPTGPTRGHSLPGPLIFGATDIDGALANLNITSITRLTPPAPTMTAADESLLALSATYRVRYAGAVEPSVAAAELEQVAGVDYAEPNRYRETYAVPNDPRYVEQWGLAKINCPTAWDKTTGSAGITVAVIDTGVDINHPELAGLLVAGYDMVDLGPNPVPPAGWRFEGDFMGRDNDPQDEVWHGTHVAGTIACASNNGVGVAGVTWNCRIMPVKVMTRLVDIANPNRVSGIGTAADIAAGIRWAVDNGARVLNMSLGGESDTQVERDAIAYAIAKGAVVVAAMGNAFKQGNPTSYPAAYPDVVAVGAITQADQRAPFSQTGPHIDVVAPGVGILSTVWDDGYASMQGTSMASPHVAGVAALILSCNANLTGSQVADIIRQTARPLRDNPADPVPNDSYGYGCVDANAAVQRACPVRPPSVVLIRCPSEIVVRCPSMPAVCPSELIRCPSEFVARCPSVNALCPSEQIPCPSRTTPCLSVQIKCPSITIKCPSIAIRCPSEPMCRPQPDPLAQEEQPDAANWENYDPYGYGG